MYFVQVQLTDGDNYIPIEEAVQVEQMTVINDTALTGGGTVTLSDGTDTINIATAGTTDAAGTRTDGVPDATNGNKTIPAGGFIKIVCSTTTDASGFGCVLKLDQHLIG